MILRISSKSKQFKRLELIYDDYLIIIISNTLKEPNNPEIKQKGLGCRIGRQYPVSKVKGAIND